MTHSFEALGLRAELLRAVTELGYDTPTPIQLQAIPALMSGRDVLGQAQTGTGKTAAFALPMLHHMNMAARGVQALVLTPTRELATQVANAIHEYGQHLDAKIMPIYGGQSYSRQESRIKRGVHVIVATPGRLIDLLDRGMLNLETVRYVVLDEADEMLKMGFIDDVANILGRTPTDRQTALFSATLPTQIEQLAAQYLRQPLRIEIERATLTVEQITQRYFLVHEESKIPALSRLLEIEQPASALIFARTRAGAAELSEALIKRGYLVDVISGDLMQDAREHVLRRFRNGDLPVLVATDVVARGIDIPEVSHVFNFDLPHDPEDYVHRIGRTGRAGRSGIAISFITPREMRRLKMVEHFTKQRIERAELPKLEEIRAHRDRYFVESLAEVMQSGQYELGSETLALLTADGYPPEAIAAAAIQLARRTELDRPVDHIKPVREYEERPARGRRDDNGGRNGFAGRGEGSKPRRRGEREADMVRLLLDMGAQDGLRPGDVVGTIATVAGIPGKAIGAIDIQHAQTFFDVKDVHVEEVLEKMKKHNRLRGKRIQLTRVS
jgi:ATP-dependent RNA helicase DeaD